MLNNKIPIVASWLALSVIAWFSMMAASFGLQHDLTQAFDWWLLPVFAIPLAVFCTIKALRPAGKLPRIVRVIFWVITLAGAALIALLLWGQAEVLQYRRDIKMLAFAATLLALLVLWLGIRVRRVKMAGGAVFRWIPDCVIGGVCLVFILGGTRCAFARIYVPSLGRQAEARWAAIGRPMPEFERSLRVVEENDSLRKLTRDLQPFGVTSFYKWRWGQGDGKPDEIKVPEELTDFLEAVQDSKSDWIDLTVKNLPGFLNAHRSELDRLYQGILQRVPPVWGFVPKDGIWVRVPGYLSARKLSQIICADAIYRFEQGDTRGATDAVAAGMKMTGNLGEQPVLVSSMIRASIEALFAKAIARLPEDPDALKNLEFEVKTKRRQWLTTLQWECWAAQWSVTHFGEGVNASSPTLPLGNNPNRLFRISPLPHIVISRLGRPEMQIYAYNTWLAVADQIEITRNADDLASTDLGSMQMEAASERHPTFFSPSWSRAWLRLNLSFLLREQAALIGWSRSQMQAGKTGNLGELPSVVIPTSKWVITGDAATNSVSMKLTPAPQWTTDNTVAASLFFLLPLDGSKSWKFN